MSLFDAVKFDDEHKKKFDEFRSDYEKIAKNFEKILPSCRERERAFERLIESFSWLGRAVRTSQLRCNAQAKKEKTNEFNPITPTPKEPEPKPTTPKRVLILKKK